MPIRPENRSRYPDDWKAISAKVRKEAREHCEWCGAGNGVKIRRGTTASGQAVYRINSWSETINGNCAETGVQVPNSSVDQVTYGDPVKVVLTVAHLDHQPENCARENLRALCQRCHNAYDAPMRRRGITERKKANRACGDLFEQNEHKTGLCDPHV